MQRKIKILPQRQLPIYIYKMHPITISTSRLYAFPLLNPLRNIRLQPNLLAPLRRLGVTHIEPAHRISNLGALSGRERTRLKKILRQPSIITVKRQISSLRRVIEALSPHCAAVEDAVREQNGLHGSVGSDLELAVRKDEVEGCAVV